MSLITRNMDISDHELKRGIQYVTDNPDQCDGVRVDSTWQLSNFGDAGPFCATTSMRFSMRGRRTSGGRGTRMVLSSGDMVGRTLHSMIAAGVVGFHSVGRPAWSRPLSRDRRGRVPREADTVKIYWTQKRLPGPRDANA